MLFTPHFVAAGVVGEYIGNPFLAFLAGIIIHFILDSVPHYDTTDEGRMTFRQYALVFVDVVFCFTLVLVILKILPAGNPNFWWGGFGGVLPDLLDNIPWWQNQFRTNWFGRKFHFFHDKIQSDQPPWFLGLATQIITLIIFIYWHLHLWTF